MLQALLEREIVPDLVLGTSIGALNGAMVARDPSLGCIERMTELWTGAVDTGREVYGDRPFRTVRRAVATGTHLYSREAAAAAVGRGVRRRADRGPAGVLPGLCGQHRTGHRALVHQGPGRGRRGRQRRRTRPAAAGPRRGRALPRRRHRQLDPARAGRHLGATRVFVLQVGRIDRPLRVPKRPWEVARVSFEIARRHRFVRELAELPDHVEAHVLPARGTSERDDTLFGTRDFGGVEARIQGPTTPASAYLDEHLGSR